MDSIVQPLTKLAEALQGFVSDREIRLLHVVASAPVRLAVLEHIAAAEHSGDNHAPFFILETPAEAPEEGWEGRVEELRTDYEELRTLVAEADEGLVLPELWPAPQAPSPLACFTLELAEALRRLQAPWEGLVVVLAPLWVQQPERWSEQVQGLLAQRELKRVRWVVVETDGPHCAQVVSAQGPAAVAVDVRIDEQAIQRDIARMLAAVECAPEGVTGMQHLGAAGPREAPPARPGVRVPLEAGGQQAVRHKVLRAAQALREGRAAQAVEYQREARDVCLRAGREQEAVSLELVLGAYLLQAGVPAQGLEVFHQARERARACGLGGLATQAQLGSAAALRVLQRQEEARLAYAEAGRLGTEAGTPQLALEGYRLSGQLAAAAGLRAEAATAWEKALEVAAAGSPEEPQSPSVQEVAQQLAALYRQQGLSARAQALEARGARPQTPPRAEEG